MRLLFGTYLGLMRAFKEISHALMVGEITADEIMASAGV